MDVMSERVFDAGELAEKLMNDEEVIFEIISVYKEDTPTQIDALEKALEGGDYETAASIIHTMKGAAGSIGAMRMAATVRRCEIDIKNDGALPAGRVAELRDRYAELESLFDRCYDGAV